MLSNSWSLPTEVKVYLYIYIYTRAYTSIHKLPWPIRRLQLDDVWCVDWMEEWMNAKIRNTEGKSEAQKMARVPNISQSYLSVWFSLFCLLVTTKGWFVGFTFKQTKLYALKHTIFAPRWIGTNQSTKHQIDWIALDEMVVDDSKRANKCGKRMDESAALDCAPSKTTTYT